MAALLRTLWNGWCTARRFQQQAACPFCQMDAKDELEHTPFCSAVREVGRKRLALPPESISLSRWLLLLPTEPEELARHCRLMYATYTAANRIRHFGAHLNAVDRKEFLDTVLLHYAG